jgi:two-component system, cell cycle response regulator DivK
MLPLTGTGGSHPEVERRHGLRPQRILVADDVADVRELWTCWLSQWGFHVVEAENGLEAVRCATAAPPTLILMDISMPVMDGWRATEILKALPATAEVPIVAITAAGSIEHYAARAAVAGCDALVSKPCELFALLHHVRSALRRSRDRAGPFGAVGPASRI